MNKVLILGGSGLVGKAILNEMNHCAKYQPYATYCNHHPGMNDEQSFILNVENIDDLYHILKTVKPDRIISCLRGDFDKQLLLHIKAAEYLRENGGSLYFFSTTNVFDHDLSRPHYEDDLPDSQTDYGQYKIECENKMIEILRDCACILRLPQVWGTKSPRMNQLINSLQENKKITVYPKLYHNTNTDVMIAKQVCYIIDHNLKGIFHLASDDAVNYRDFYQDLILGLGFHNANLEENCEEEGYFALLSKRSKEFPKELRFSNQDVLHYLTNKMLD